MPASGLRCHGGGRALLHALLLLLLRRPPRLLHALYSKYLFRGNTSAVSKSSKIDRPRRPAAQSAHRATAAPMLRAYVDRGLGAVPARYR